MSVKLDVCEFTLTHTSIEMAEAWYEEPKRRVGTTTINDQVFASCSTISNGKWSTKRDSRVIDGSFAGGPTSCKFTEARIDGVPSTSRMAGYARARAQSKIKIALGARARGSEGPRT